MTTGHLAQRDVFLAEIRDDPDDDVPRLILGDWLADQGDPRGEFIQIDVRLESMPEGAERRALEERRRQLLAAHAVEWLGSLLEVVSEWRWERGMLHVTARAERLLAQSGLDALQADSFSWVEGVALREVGSLNFPGLPTLLGRITSLEVRHDIYHRPILRPVLRREESRGLRSLMVTRIDHAGMRELTASPNLTGLLRLDLSEIAINDQGAHWLADSRHLNHLRSLDLTGADLSFAMRARLDERFGPGVVRLA